MCNANTSPGVTQTQGGLCRFARFDTIFRLMAAIFATVGGCDETEGGQLQANSHAGIWDTQSAAGRGASDGLSDGRFLRCKRSGASEIRNVAQRGNRWGQCEQKRADVWVLPSRVVSGQDQLRSTWIGGITATAARPQKTVEGHNPVELIQLLHEQYELLRAEVLDSSRLACGQGMMTMLSRGMAGWIESLQAQYERTRTISNSAICVANEDIDHDWVQALVALVMGAKAGVQHG